MKVPIGFSNQEVIDYLYSSVGEDGNQINRWEKFMRLKHVETTRINAEGLASEGREGA